MKTIKEIFRRAVNLLLVPLLVVGGFPLGINNVIAAEGDEAPSTEVPEDAPAHSKKLIDNGDGTYTLSLSVTGKADTSVTHDVTKSNVILLIDISNSMTASTPGYTSRLAAEKEALTKTDGIIDKLLANNTSDVTDALELYGISFGQKGAVAWDWSTDGTTIKSTINGLTPGQSGTNWEEALILAKQAADAKHAAEPDDNTFVILLTDGEPTTHQNDYSVSTNYAQEWGYASDDARAIVTAGYAFYGIFTFGSGNSSRYLSSLVNYAYTGTGNSSSSLSSQYAGYFYDATDTSALVEALETIVNDITSSIGYTNIEITDGLTDLTSSVKVDGKISNLTYTRSGGNYGDGEIWAEAPEATTTNGTVDWNLHNTVLEDGVTYTVSFLVWPSQEAYDLVAELNNGKVSYDSLSPSQKSSIINNNGVYTLKTNTDYPTLTYSTVTTTSDGTDTTVVVSDPKTFAITNPEPVGLKGQSLTLEKKWEDSLDPSQREEVGDTVVLDFYKDNTPYETGVSLTKQNGWKLPNRISIAPGIMLSNDSPNYNALKGDHTEYEYGGKKYIILETGHDYYFQEENINYHFELTNHIYHPMIIGDTLMNVSFTRDGSGNITGIEGFTVLDSVSATNTLKGGINIVKEVKDKEGNVIDTDDSFEVTAYLVDAEGNPYKYDYRIYYGEKNPAYEANIVYKTDENGDYVYDEEGNKIVLYSRTGHIIGTGSFTEQIYLGDTIRIVNVDSGVQYRVVETEKNGYDENPVITYKERYGGTSSQEKDATCKNNYCIVSGNTASSVKITNTFKDERTSVDFEKTWYDEEGNPLSGKNLPGKITINLVEQAADGTETTIDSTDISAETDWKGSFEGLPKYDNGETIIYTVKEGAIEGATPGEQEDTFFEYDTVLDNGKYAVKGKWTWKVETLEDIIIKNTWKPATERTTGTTSFNVKKVDKATGAALPGASFELKLKDGTTYTATTNADGEATFSGLGAGEYTLKETAAPDDYKSIADQPTINITSIRRLNTVDITNLENLYKYVFSISANNVGGYTYDAETRTYTVENERIPYSDITITKVWDDLDNHDGARPTSLTINLLADGKDNDSIKLTADNAVEGDDNTWTYTFEHKPTTKVDGSTISYTISEDETVLGDYEASYDAEADPLTITNAYTPKTTTVSGSKTWVYNGIEENLRPTSIKVGLYDERETKLDEATVAIDEEGNWTYNFKDLPVYRNENGTVSEISYSVKELEVEGTTLNKDGNFYTYDTVENNGKYAVKGKWTVQTLEDYILQNTWTPATETVTGLTSLTINKIDSSTKASLSGAVFTLKADDGTETTATTNSDGVASFTDLDAGTYTITETTAPDKHILNASTSTITITKIKKLMDVNLASLFNTYEYEYTLSATSTEGYTFDANAKTFTVENDPIPYDDITITKVWDDSDNHDGARPTSLTITLFADGKEDDSYTLTDEDATENDSNTWTHTFENKPTTTTAGATISYTIAEDETVLGDYEASYNAEVDPLTITNAYTPKTTSISGSKNWQYNGLEETLYPTSIKVGLYDERNTKLDEATVAIDTEGNWSYSFEDLPVYRNEDGTVSKISYSVKELEVEGTTFDTAEDAFFKYDTVEDNGKYAVQGKWTVQTLEDYILQNTWTPATETVSGLTSLNIKKIDSDTEESLSGAVFTLKADDGTETTATTNSDGIASFTDLDAGVYTITETTAPDDHILLSSSSTVTITKVKKLMDVNISTLLNTYEYEFTSTADAADGYTFDADSNTFTVKNDAITHDDITVYKVWEDDSDRDSVRPSSIALTLIGSNDEEYEATLTADENADDDDPDTWSYTFEDVPMVTVDGDAITYTIAEDETAIGDYTASYDQEALIVYNTYEPETVDIYGYKVWQDGDNISGLRPTTLEVKLLDGNGDEFDSVIIFEDENGDWNFSFEGLPKYQKVGEKSEEITYTVEEVVDINYTVSYSEDEDGCVVITNTLKGYGNVPPETPDTGHVTNTESSSARISYGIGYVSLILFVVIATVFSKSKAKRK